MSKYTTNEILDLLSNVMVLKEINDETRAAFAQMLEQSVVNSEEGIQKIVKTQTRFLTELSQYLEENLPKAQTINAPINQAISEIRQLSKSRWRSGFLAGVAILLLTVACAITPILTARNTAEKWAFRMYIAQQEMGETNPAVYFEEVLSDFQIGQAESAKEKVIWCERVNQHRKHFTGKLSDVLSQEFPSGIKIIQYEEYPILTDKPKMLSFFQPTKDKHEVAFMFVRDADGDRVLRIALERRVSILRPQKWDVYITESTKINSLDDYLTDYKNAEWRIIQGAF